MADANKRAVALKYDPAGGTAPTVVAKGGGAVAERIVELARSGGVAVREDPALVSVLSKLEVDQEIPPQLYAVVATLLAFLYRANRPTP